MYGSEFKLPNCNWSKNDKKILILVVLKTKKIKKYNNLRLYEILDNLWSDVEIQRAFLKLKTV
jgi:hypothetical protein